MQGAGGDDPYHTTLSNVAKLPLKSGIIKKILLGIRFGEGFLYINITELPEKGRAHKYTTAISIMPQIMFQKIICLCTW